MDKTQLIVGGLYEVRTDRPLRDGVVGFMSNNHVLPYVTAHNPFDDVMMSHFQLPPSQQVELVHGPKKKKGLNVVRVRHPQTQAEGYVFWCEFKVNMLEVAPKPAMKI